jgi:hypothetical protein
MLLPTMELTPLFVNILQQEILQKLSLHGERTFVNDDTGTPVINPKVRGIILMYITDIVTKLRNHTVEKPVELNAVDVKLLIHSLTDLYNTHNGTYTPCTAGDDSTLTPEGTTKIPASPDWNDQIDEEKAVEDKVLKSSPPATSKTQKKKQRQKKLPKKDPSLKKKKVKPPPKSTATAGSTQKKAPSIVSAAMTKFKNRRWMGGLICFTTNGCRVSSVRPSILDFDMELPIGTCTLENLHGPTDGCNVCNELRNRRVAQPTRRMYYMIALSHEDSFGIDQAQFEQLYDELENRRQKGRSDTSDMMATE